MGLFIVVNNESVKIRGEI